MSHSSEQDTIQRITALHEEFKRDLNDQSSRDGGDYPMHQIESGIDDEEGSDNDEYDDEEDLDDFEDSGNVDRRGNMIIIHR